MAHEHSPFWAAAAAGGIAGLSGLAALLRSDQPLSWRAGLAASLTCSTTGVVVYLLLGPAVADQVLRIGVAALAGAGGGSTLDILLAALQKIARVRLNGDTTRRDS